MAGHTAHVAPALSCVDIIASLYFHVLRISPQAPDAPGRDIFLLSKGHGCMALYSVLAHAGFFDPEILKTYGQNGSPLAEHPLAGKVPGIEFAAGSLGHGLAVAAGMAQGFKLRNNPARVFTLLGDGECEEGAVWEAAALARALRLDNLTAIIDWNGWQACGRCEDISDMDLPRCWDAFGWNVNLADGHDVPALASLFTQPNPQKIPRVVLCRTTKGKGIDFMENNLEWHYRPVRGAEKDAALKCLEP